MNYRKLNGTNISLSELGIGTWAIGGPYWTDDQSTGWTGPIDETDIQRAIHLAIGAGVNHIDTADVYGYGRSERTIGRALRDIPRESVVLATKVGWVKTSAPSPFTPSNIRSQCEQSLRNLQTDYIDIYYFHHCNFGDNDEYLADAVSTMNELRAEGKIRSTGVSGYSEADLLRVSRIARPTVIQSWADVEHDEFIRDGGALAQFMRSEAISFIPMMPYAQGRLLGKYSSKAPPEFEDGDNRQGSSAFSAESLAELEPRLEALRDRFGPSIGDLARVALHFLLASEVVASVIPGFRSSAQVEMNLHAAAAPSLSAKDLSYIESVFPRAQMSPHPWASD